MATVTASRAVCPACDQDMPTELQICPTCHASAAWVELLRASDFVDRRFKEWHKDGRVNAQAFEKVTGALLAERQAMLGEIRAGKKAPELLHPPRDKCWSCQEPCGETPVYCGACGAPTGGPGIRSLRCLAYLSDSVRKLEDMGVLSLSVAHDLRTDTYERSAALKNKLDRERVPAAVPMAEDAQKVTGVKLEGSKPPAPPSGRRLLEILLDPRSIQWLLMSGGVLLVDTYHAPTWDGPGLSQWLYGLKTEALSHRGVGRGTSCPRLRAQAPVPSQRRDMMRFYNQAHRFYCGIDLHARSMYLCILDEAGTIVLHKNLATSPQAFLQAIAPFRDGLVVAAECMFAWYWVADLCRAEGIPFVLGHALYMKAIHGGKTKNDKIDSFKIATLLRGGTLAQAYVYPKGMRETRDLLRRRSFLVRQRALLIAHIQNEASQYNLSAFAKKLSFAANREELQVAEHFADPSVKQSIQTDLALIDVYDQQIGEVELYLTRHAKIDDGNTFHRLRSIPGVGKILALIFLYEIHDINRFADVGKFLSYARLVRGSHESAGKKKGSPGKKIGNAHLKWVFGEAACLLIRHSECGKAWLKRKEKKCGKAKALAILAAKLGRTVYHLWRKREVFDETRVFAS